MDILFIIINFIYIFVVNQKIIIIMKRILLFFIILSGISLNAQVTVFEDSFESYPDFAITGYGDWQTIDVDLRPTYTGGLPTGINPTWANAGAPMSFQIFNPSTTTPQIVTNSTTGVGGETENRNFDTHTGLKYAACWDAVPNATVTANNDWLVSPVLNLGASNNEVRFWVKSLSDSYGLEKYRVGVYVGTGTPVAADFVFISGIPALSAPFPAWEEKIFPLNAYSNQSIRIGIKCQSADNYMFMVDDFIVTSSNLRNDDYLSNKFSVYPNPVNNVININNSENALINEVTITDINGRTIKNVNSNVSQTEINVSELNTGVYFLKINSDIGNAIKKFVKN